MRNIRDIRTIGIRTCCGKQEALSLEFIFQGFVLMLSHVPFDIKPLSRTGTGSTFSPVGPLSGIKTDSILRRQI